MKQLGSFLATPCRRAVQHRLSVALAMAPIFSSTALVAQTPPPVYPEGGTTTQFINQDAVIGAFPEPACYKANIPFIDLPDKTIENVYYYPWRVAHQAQKFTGARDCLII